MTNITGIRPRGDFVLVRIIDLGKTPSGIAIPQVSVEGKRFVVEAVGPDVPKDLQIGDSVLLRGEAGSTNYYPLPRCNDLLVIKEEYIVVVFDKHEPASR